MAKNKSTGKTKTKFDFQQFLLTKGEKIAMIVAAVGLALLALFGIMAASHAESPNGLAGKLRDGVTMIDSQLLEVKGQNPEKPVLPEGVVYRVVSVDEFKTPNDWFNTSGNIIEKRVNPTILTATEGSASFVSGGVGVWSIQDDKIAVIENRVVAKNNPGLIKHLQKNANRPQPKAPPPAAAPAAPAAPQVGNPGGRGGAGPQLNQGRSGEPEIVYIPLEGPQINNAQLAINCQPIRMAVVEGIVPYKAQVQKYLNALRLETDSALEAEGSAPAYQGLIVERQVLAADGKTELQDWTFFDHVAEIRDLYRITAEFVTEDPRYKDFIPDPSHQLYIRLPKFVRGAYSLSNLSELGKALQEIQKSGPPKNLEGKAKRVGGEENIFDPQDIASQSSGQPKGPPGIASEGRPTGPPNRQAGPGREGQLAPGQQPRNNAVPVWKFQFFDPTIEAGKCYRYRVKFKVLNPNLGRKDQVAIPSAASVKELVSDDWYTIPSVVFCPPEEYLYAHGDKHKDRYDDTTVLKYHRWYEFIRVNRDSLLGDPVAEWVIADIEAKRGQKIEQNKGFKVPLWSMVHGAYIFREQNQAIKPKTRMQVYLRENVRMDFMPRDPTFLVDFEGGRGSYKLPNGNGVQDESVAEILLLTDDGKTLAVTCRNTFADSARADRLQREENWRKWLEEVEGASKRANEAPAAGGNPKAGP